MTNKISATFIRRRFQDSGKDQAPDYYVYEFTNIVDIDGNKYNDKWIKETKLMEAISFHKGNRYEITLSDRVISNDSIKLPFPTEISWDTGRVYLKGGNSIIRVDKNNTEENLSVPINKILGISNYEKAALNKFAKGILNEDLLLKMNSRGIFYYVNHSDPQDKRKSGGINYGSTAKGDGNYIIIKKETQIEIDKTLENIKRNYVTPAILKHFSITTELLPLKKKKS